MVVALISSVRLEAYIADFTATRCLSLDLNSLESLRNNTVFPSVNFPLIRQPNRSGQLSCQKHHAI